MEAAQTIKRELDRWIIIVKPGSNNGEQTAGWWCSLRVFPWRACVFSWRIHDHAFSLSNQSFITRKIYIIEFERRRYDEFVLDGLRRLVKCQDVEIALFGIIIINIVYGYINFRDFKISSFGKVLLIWFLLRDQRLDIIYC